jgi:glycosyltransferase involved in cell wall biosynthesis
MAFGEEGPASIVQPDPVIRIVLVTYNHENFIAQCIDSILMQRVTCSYEILILEDYSTDGTRDIVREYFEKYPEVIHLSLAKRNKNSNEDWANAMKTARGEFVALMDGDDYWTSPYKLQKQVDYLRAHPECSMCFHNVSTIYEDGRNPGHLNPSDQPMYYSMDEILRFNNIAGSSPMFRASACSDLPEWIVPLKWGDWGLNIWAALKGKIGYIVEDLAIYRIHHRGFYSGMSRVDQLRGDIEFYETIRSHLPVYYADQIEQELGSRQELLQFEMNKPVLNTNID